MIKVGNKVEHILTKDWFIVLEINDSIILCRTKDLREIPFRKFELREIK